jgi:hypothetical protein
MARSRSAPRGILDAMTSASVTELPRPLEPISADPFIDGLEGVALRLSLPIARNSRPSAKSAVVASQIWVAADAKAAPQHVPV